MSTGIAIKGDDELVHWAEFDDEDLAAYEYKRDRQAWFRSSCEIDLRGRFDVRRKLSMNMSDVTCLLCVGSSDVVD